MVIKREKHRYAVFPIKLCGRSMLVVRLEAKQPPAGKVFKKALRLSGKRPEHRDESKG
jgi:hypothetical protein